MYIHSWDNPLTVPIICTANLLSHLDCPSNFCSSWHTSVHCTHANEHVDAPTASAAAWKGSIEQSSSLSAQEAGMQRSCR